jgi:signal transduction histidine kinase
LAELRDLARGIHPAILTEQGLAAAVESLADRIPVPVELDLTVGRRLHPTVESTAYFVTSEAVANIVKHAGAAQARISARLETGSLTVEVVDDGAGGADPAGSGLRGLADRVAALDGSLQVTSERGQGTTVRAVLPCE